MEKEKKIYKTIVGDVVIEIIYIGELLGVNIPNANINYGLNEVFIKKKNHLIKEYIRDYIIFATLFTLYVISILLSNKRIFYIFSFLSPLFLVIIMSKIWYGEVKIKTTEIILIMFLEIISLFLLGEINVKQIIDLCTNYLGQKH